MRLMLVGDPGPTRLGAHLLEAARAVPVDVELCDTRQAFAGPLVWRKACWWMGGHRPARLGAFSAQVVDRVRQVRPDVILASGLAPLSAGALRAIGALGVRRANFLTDDPWNPAHRAPWFMQALAQYDWAFSPRRANLADLTHAGVPHVEYLPFGYSPSAHYYEPPVTEAEWQRFDAEVLLAGGADADRIATVTPLVHAGLRVALYGGYWTHDRATRGSARGWLDVASLRKATAAARVCLGLVRRANRDGHAMRSFEIPAMKGCLLAERTTDHEELFGADGDAVLFFDDEASLIDRARWLVGHPQDRDRLAARAHDLVTTGGHTYRDRLIRMLDRATS